MVLHYDDQRDPAMECVAPGIRARARSFDCAPNDPRQDLTLGDRHPRRSADPHDPAAVVIAASAAVVAVMLIRYDPETRTTT